MSSIYYDVNIHNSGEEEIPCAYDQVENIPVLARMENYRLAVNKFSLPAAALKRTSVNPNKTYSVMIAEPYFEDIGEGGLARWMTGYKEVAIDIPAYTQYSYDHANEFLEAVNRTYIETFKSMCTKSTFTASGVISPGSPSLTINATDPNGQTRTGAVEIKVTVSTALLCYAHSLRLTSPHSKSAYLVQNAMLAPSNVGGYTTVTFSDSNLEPYTIETARGKSTKAYPVESFAEIFSDQGWDGTWVLQWLDIDGASSSTLNAQVELSVYHYDKAAGIRQLTSKDIPYFEIKDNLIQCTLPEEWVWHGLRLGWNRALRDVLNYDDRQNPSPAPGSTAGSYWYLTPPQISVYSEALNESIVVKQHQTSVHKTTSYPSRILLKGDLPTRKIRSGIQGQSASSQAYVEEFYIDPSSFDGSDFIFNARVLRYHDLLSTGPLSEISLQVQIQYEDGLTIPLNLVPGDTARIQLQFTERESAPI